MLNKVRIVGSGLIGTSVGLSLKAQGVVVQMVDSDEASQALANDLVGGLEVSNPDVVIFATPISQIPLIIEREYALNPNSTFMDVGSVKNEVLLEVEKSSLPLTRFVPTHPMAGREIGGVQSARADLFAARSWVITPTNECLPESINLVIEVIKAVGADLIALPADEHDRAVAVVSHLPQILASLLAQGLHSIPDHWLDLAGGGLRDTTRIASSDAQLWSEIIFSNRREISIVAESMYQRLGELIESLDNKEFIREFIEKGKSGRLRIPGKHGGTARDYSYLPIVIDDKPGQLAAIFNECANISVNVEDLSIEHSPGQLSALITLALSDNDAIELSAHLSAIGWNVHPVLK
ncbi:MAG: prephenate dehydrogenase/arogenate dehydrogenase family protein [Actinobacteria bacterium]|uniref:Prephenate dehydrogenase n=1 Tax=freshwater metagenome TaxID=449393 RepID=A0A6J7CRS6_9ZZZZ|nr:prephenate dehydrogenase/arogenate dehydrogenase family protein [Actinomycetota bacterium]